MTEYMLSIQRDNEPTTRQDIQTMTEIYRCAWLHTKGSRRNKASIMQILYSCCYRALVVVASVSMFHCNIYSSLVMFQVQ